MSFKLSRLRSPIRRVLALDAGSRRIRLLLAQSEFGRFRLLKQECIDLHEEGLVSADEITASLQERLEALGSPPLALVLPQHLSNSQVIDLPLTAEHEVEKLIQDEAIKLSGVSDSRIIYDFVRIENPNKNRQQFWVTLCREADIHEKIRKLGLEEQDLCEVTPTANALVAAWAASAPHASRAILVHAGAQSTVVAVFTGGQGVFAASFQMGGDFFTRSLARLRNIPEEAAEQLKRDSDLLGGPNASADFRAVVDGWAAELKRQLTDWLDHHSGARPSLDSFEMVASGGAFDQPGLLDYLKAQAGLNLKPWSAKGHSDIEAPAEGFEAAGGAALLALGCGAQPVSLLPPEYRAKWQKRLVREKIEIASLFLLILCTLLLALGSWRQLLLVTRKQAFLNKVQTSQVAVEANEALSAKLVSEYETLRPLFASQQNTLDILNTLALLQQSRSNRSFWYVLLADQQSYFNAPRLLASTNKSLAVTTVTNTVLTNLASPPAPLLSVLADPPLLGTNISPAKPGLIAELSVPEDAEAARIVLSQLVRELKQQKLFSKVDLLSDDLRRSLADPKVIIPDRDYVLALDFALTDFQPTARARKVGVAANSRTPTKRGSHPASSSENSDSPNSGVP